MSSMFREGSQYAAWEGEGPDDPPEPEEAFCVFCLKAIPSGDCCDKCAKEIDPPNGYPEEPQHER